MGVAGFKTYIQKPLLHSLYKEGILFHLTVLYKDTKAEGEDFVVPPLSR